VSLQSRWTKLLWRITFQRHGKPDFCVHKPEYLEEHPLSHSYFRGVEKVIKERADRQTPEQNLKTVKHRVPQLEIRQRMSSPFQATYPIGGVPADSVGTLHHRVDHESLTCRYSCFSGIVGCLFVSRSRPWILFRYSVEADVHSATLDNDLLLFARRFLVVTDRLDG